MEAPKITKELLGGLVLTSCVSLLVELDIFRCRFVLCVCPGLCKYISIYTARSVCCCMFAPFCLRVYLSLFLAILCCPPPHTPTLTSLHTYTHTHTRVKAQLTHTPSPPPCVFPVCSLHWHLVLFLCSHGKPVIRQRALRVKLTV